MQHAIDKFFNILRQRAPGVQALVLLNAHGECLGHAAVDPQFKTEFFASEYATFLRIARMTVKDTGMGDIDEHILVSQMGVVIIRRLPEDHFAVFVSAPGEQLGRLRYELKRSLLYSTFFHYELERT